MTGFERLKQIATDLVAQMTEERVHTVLVQVVSDLAWRPPERRSHTIDLYFVRSDERELPLLEDVTYTLTVALGLKHRGGSPHALAPVDEDPAAYIRSLFETIIFPLGGTIEPFSVLRVPESSVGERKRRRLLERARLRLKKGG